MFDLVADVEKQYGVDGGYTYTLALRDNKKIKASPALAPKTEAVKVAEDTSNLGQSIDLDTSLLDPIIAEDGKKVNDESLNFSISDSDGKTLSEGQQTYFKDSKMRDDNGNLKVMYHGSQDAGFHTFDAKMSDDDTSFFFVDSNDVAAKTENSPCFTRVTE